MITVKVQENIRVEATGVEYKKGQEVEVSDELAKRHIKTGIFKEVTATKARTTRLRVVAAAKPKQDLPEPSPEPIQEPEVK